MCAVEEVADTNQDVQGGGSWEQDLHRRPFCITLKPTLIMDRMDVYEMMPSGMNEYLSNYGWHFSKKLCEHAVKKMTDRLGKKITPYTKEQVEALMKQFNVQVENNEGYDAVYVANMAKADYMGSSITTEQHLMLYVKDFLDDKDGNKTKALDHYYADCIAGGKVVIWEEML